MSRSLRPLHGRKAQLDVPKLRAHCAERVAAGEAAQTVDMLLDLIEAMAERMTRLEQQVDRLLHDRYARKSERLSTAQLTLALDAAATPLLLADSPDATAPDPALPALPPATRPARTRPERKLRSSHLPAHLPRTHTLSEPSAQELCCTTCGRSKKFIGSETSELLDWVPGGFHVEQIERRKYACDSCESGVVIGPAPVRVLDGALPGPGLLAEIIVRKGNDHCPLERQSRIFTGRFGVPISPSTLGVWFARTLDQLSPIAERIGQRALSRSHLSVDDTGVQVLDRNDSRGIKRGHLWPFRTDSEVSFVYTPSWQGKPIQEILKDFRGTLQTDGFAGLDALYKRPGAPIRAGCLAHLRRKFVQAFEQGDLRAAHPLALIQKIYAVEKKASEDALDVAARQRLRDELSRPLMTALRAQVDQLSYQAPPKTPLGRAITYALRQWDTLTVFLDDGALRPDNNATENTLRPVAEPRLFCPCRNNSPGSLSLASVFRSDAAGCVS